MNGQRSTVKQQHRGTAGHFNQADERGNYTNTSA